VQQALKKDKRPAALALIQYIFASRKVKRFAFARPSWRYVAIIFWAYTITAVTAMAAITYEISEVKQEIAQFTYLATIDSEQAEGHIWIPVTHIAPKPHITHTAARTGADEVIYAEVGEGAYMPLYEPNIEHTEAAQEPTPLPWESELLPWGILTVRTPYIAFPGDLTHDELIDNGWREVVCSRLPMDINLMMLSGFSLDDYIGGIAPPRLVPPGFITPCEEDVLAAIVWAEARGESLRGQILVVNVILNRLAHPDFPDTIRDVVFQRALNSQGRWIYQFSPIYNGSFDRAVPGEMQFEAVRLALGGTDYSRGALYFRAICHCLEGGWHERALTPLLDYGAHRFYE
jgi:hypothetical protein